MVKDPNGSTKPQPPQNPKILAKVQKPAACPAQTKDRTSIPPIFQSITIAWLIKQCVSGIQGKRDEISG